MCACVRVCTHSATASKRASNGSAKKERRSREINPLSIIDEAYAKAKQAHEVKLRKEEREKEQARRAAAAREVVAHKSLAKLNTELGISNSKEETLAAAMKPVPAPAHAAKLAATASKPKNVVKHVAAAPRKADKAEINPLAVIEQV